MIPENEEFHPDSKFLPENEDLYEINVIRLVEQASDKQTNEQNQNLQNLNDKENIEISQDFIHEELDPNNYDIDKFESLRLNAYIIHDGNITLELAGESQSCDPLIMEIITKDPLPKN